MTTTTNRSRLALLALLFGLAAAAAACGKREGGEPAIDRAVEGPPRIAPGEAERGRAACQGYIDQVCDCALKDAELAAECEMAPARREALDKSLRAAMAEGNATERDRQALHANALQIARACIEDSAALVKRGCAPPGRRPGASPTTGVPGDPAAPSRPVPAPPPEPEPAQDPTR